MSNKVRKAQKRKVKLQKRQKSSRERIAIHHDGETRTLIQQHTDKGYDVQMVRDFLEQLLLELRVQHYENLKALRALESTNDMKQAYAAAAEPSDSIINQMTVFQSKYATALMASNVIDGDDATEREVKEFAKELLQTNIERRDSQIGHLEALQDLFEEALMCARVPFGIDRDGNPVGPQRVHRVVGDEEQFGIPDYDELLPRFKEHPMATVNGIHELKEAAVIVATSAIYEELLVLYGADIVERARDEGEREVRAFPVEVSSFEELQFVLSAIQKFVGPPDTDGESWRDL
ncbi:MAG TPA: hypothetical protein VNQ76_15045 [Planctomicrobium sp.]|nr:hypothetical protein [Planctomicrobium sp.]